MWTRTISMTAVAVAAVLATGCGEDRSLERQRDVAERGGEVMPFDLDATTHRFIKQPGGGLQIVVADKPGDRRQVQLIRQHLREEARAFRRGDFEDPAAIHGTTMPGLETLRNAGEKLTIDISERRDGAQLAYRTRDPAVADALHAWFDAQVGDHGQHAQAR